jgi:hypothetical protein
MQNDARKRFIDRLAKALLMTLDAIDKPKVALPELLEFGLPTKMEDSKLTQEKQ